MGGIGVLLCAASIAGCGGAGENGAGASLNIVRPGDVNLGLASTFALFGGAAGVTNQGTGTVIVGDVGTSGASTMITGFHNSAFSYTETPLNIGAVTGTVYTDAPQGTAASFAIANATAADALAAFNYLAALPNGQDPGAGELGGLTLVPGVYKAAGGAFRITGSDLTLDAGGNADSVWVFQMPSSLTVGAPASPRSVILANGAQGKNVYWQVGSAATVNGAGGGTMVGTILSSAAITFSTAGNAIATTLAGRALALNAAVTMVNTVINAYGVNVPLPIVGDPTLSHLTVDGLNAADVVTFITLGGFITVHNGGGHVVATVTGVGSLDIANNGGALTATETGSGTIKIKNDGGVLTATNTGNGVMTIDSTATGAVTVTNTGNGNVTVNTSGAGAVTYTHTGNEDVAVTLP
jgi:hypothetical protein